MNNYVHLHAHSEFSMDAISSYKELLETAKNNGQNALAMTEHQHLGGAVEFIQTAKGLGIKPIVGNEFYVEVDGLVTHLTVLADGLIGYNNLIRCLNSGVNRSVATGKDMKRHPVTIDDLFSNSEGLVVLSGCPASMFQVEKESNDESAANLLMKFKSQFGDRLFVEGMLSSDNQQLMGLSLNRASYLSRATNIPLVITNDVHYAQKHQRIVHDFYVRQVCGFHYPDADLYLKSRSEMETTLRSLGLGSSEEAYLLSAMDNSVFIADKIQTVEFDGKLMLPTIADSDNQFKKSVWSGYERHIALVGRGADYEQALKERLDYEISVICNKGFSTYMILTQEFVNVARSGGHGIGKGRGSAAGSAVAYMLGITDINPLDYNLLFERFLNPERDSAPDIDMDFSSSGRDAVIEYAREKYQAVPIVTTSVFHHASLVRDMAKFFRVDDDRLKILLECEGTGDEWEKLCREEPDWQLIYETLMGKIRQFGKHAGGVVIDPPNSKYEMPLTIGTDGALAAFSEGGHGQFLGKVGYVKFDVLAVENLSMSQMLEQMTGQKPPEIMPNETAECFDLIMQDEVDGVFQLSGFAARNYALRFNPRTIQDISLVSALARTGAMKSGAADAFIKARQRSGQVRVRALKPLDSGNMISIEMENGITTHVYDHWQVKLIDGTWKFVRDLDKKDELYVES